MELSLKVLRIMLNNVRTMDYLPPADLSTVGSGVLDKPLPGALWLIGRGWSVARLT